MRKFLYPIEDIGVCGAELRLNLVQCQALNKLHSRIALKYDDIIEKTNEAKKDKWSKIELDTDLLTLLSEVNAFLGLFKEFKHPDTAKGLWVNEDEPSNLETYLGPNKTPVDYDVSDLKVNAEG